MSSVVPKSVLLCFLTAASGIGFVAAYSVLKKPKDNPFNKGYFVKSALEMIESRPAISELLGDNLTVGKVSQQFGLGALDKRHAEIKLPIKGDNDSGYLFIFARKNSLTQKFQLYKLEMTFNKIRDRKLVLLDVDAEEEAARIREANKPPEKKKTNHTHIPTS